PPAMTWVGSRVSKMDQAPNAAATATIVGAKAGTFHKLTFAGAWVASGPNLGAGVVVSSTVRRRLVVWFLPFLANYCISPIIRTIAVAIAASAKTAAMNVQNLDPCL